MQLDGNEQGDVLQSTPESSSITMHLPSFLSGKAANPRPYRPHQPQSRPTTAPPSQPVSLSPPSPLGSSPPPPLWAALSGSRKGSKIDLTRWGTSGSGQGSTACVSFAISWRSSLSSFANTCKGAHRLLSAG
ncbi:hypothetical protein E2562_033376 [Oryza meyeriana var. granulata]|uniref:Uncharacterized protein n=1 Tax=Oryza meyeriana var. granulata TaxID=110450 RepID=A0A6G1C0K1_9ORYZ|nr:hypothetical protein E2562_033376 [Oryza meyeriana var. granulata]